MTETPYNLKLDIANLCGERAILQQELIELGKKITQGNYEFAVLESKIESAQNELSKTLEHKHDVKVEISSEKGALMLSRKNANLDVTLSSSEVESNRKKVERLEQRSIDIQKYIDEQTKKQNELESIHSELESKIKEKTKIVSDIDSLISTRKKLVSSIQQLRKEVNDMSNQLEQTLSFTQSQMSLEEQKLEALRTAREEEEIRLNNAIEDRVRVKRDTDLYIQRAKYVFEQQFPKLKMKVRHA